jgi:hypothetical protein
MIRSALRMERCVFRRVMLLVVLVVAIGGTCVVKAAGDSAPRHDLRSAATGC